MEGRKEGRSWNLFVYFLFDNHFFRCVYIIQCATDGYPSVFTQTDPIGWRFFSSLQALQLHIPRHDGHLHLFPFWNTSRMFSPYRVWRHCPQITPFGPLQPKHDVFLSRVLCRHWWHTVPRVSATFAMFMNGYRCLHDPRYGKSSFVYHSSSYFRVSLTFVLMGENIIVVSTVIGALCFRTGDNFGYELCLNGIPCVGSESESESEFDSGFLFGFCFMTGSCSERESESE